MSVSTRRRRRWRTALLLVICLALVGVYVFVVKGVSPAGVAHAVAGWTLNRGHVDVTLPAEAGRVLTAVAFSESGQRCEGRHSRGHVIFAGLSRGPQQVTVLLHAAEGRFSTVQHGFVLPQHGSRLRLTPEIDGTWPAAGAVPFKVVGAFGRKLDQVEITVGPPDFLMGPRTRREPSGRSLSSSNALWNAFEHVAYDKNGRNPLVLPFHAASHDVAARKHEALAFSFLLSGALDWHPGCWTARHAYFIFKRSPYEMSALSSKYEPAVVRSVVTHWRSTHAVGGTLERHSDGQFSGTLSIFNPDGRTVFEKSLDRPRGYFDMLGDMAVETMTFLGHVPSPDLVAHLKEARCRYPESVDDLGRAAFLPGRSAEEFLLYRRILDRDPGFAEVRYWSANQGYWATKDRTVYNVEKARALRSYLVPAALLDLDLDGTDSKEMIALFESGLERVKSLQGGDTPLVLSLERDLMCAKGERRPADFLRRAVAVAASYPAEAAFLGYLADHLADGQAGAGDPAMAAGLYLAALGSPQHREWGTSRWFARGLAGAVSRLGYHDDAVDALLPFLRQDMANDRAADVHREAQQLGWCYSQLCCHRESASVNLLACENAQADERERHFTTAMLSCYMGGEGALLESAKVRQAAFLSPHRYAWGQMKSADVLHVADLLYSGRLQEASTALSGYRSLSGSGHDASLRLSELLVASITDLMEGQSRRRAEVENAVTYNPSLRPLWIVFDGYDRMHPLPRSAAFYEALAWLHGDDPWVRLATSDRERRQAGTFDVGLDDLVRKSMGVTPEPWPVLDDGDDSGRSRKVAPWLTVLHAGTMACAVKRLIDRGDLDVAEALCLRCVTGVGSRWNGYRAFRRHANYLYHRVQCARRAAPSPERGDTVPTGRAVLQVSGRELGDIPKSK